MSNRRRREWLIRSRVKEIVRAGDGDELDVDVATIAEYKGLVRDVFGSVRRDRLRFPDNLHGGDPQGGSLVNIQARNRPPLFNLLFDDLHQLLNEADGCRLWLDYQERLKEADSTFNAAMGILSKHRRVVSSWSDEPMWTAGMQRAARSINGVRRSVFQYADQFPSVLQSARKFWPECNDIGDSDVLAMLAADQAHAAASILVKLIKDVEERAVDEGISRRDDRRFSMLLVEMSENVRKGDWYGFGKLRRARELLRLAQLAEQEREFMRREAEAKPLVKDGRAFSEGRSKGGASRKGGTFSLFKLAVKDLCAALATYDTEKVFCEMRLDCEDDEDGGSRSETMNDLRGKAKYPVLLRFQSVPDDLSDRKAKIFFVRTDTGEEASVTVGTFRNAVTKAKDKRAAEVLEHI